MSLILDNFMNFFNFNSFCDFCVCYRLTNISKATILLNNNYLSVA